MFDNWKYELELLNARIARKWKVVIFLTTFLAVILPTGYSIYTNLKYASDSRVSTSVSQTSSTSVVYDNLMHTAYKLQDKSDYAGAFKLLVTAKNNFAAGFTDAQKEDLGITLRGLVDHAKETTVEGLYEKEDLTQNLDLYKFTGYVLEIDVDDMYGTTYSIADQKDTTLHSIEVSGLTDVAVGSTVTFYGVPEFSSVTRPLRVESF